MKRALRGVAVALAALVMSPTAAFAHGGTDRAGYSNYRTTVLAITPAVPGLRVEITDVNGGIRLTYTGTEPLVVLGYDGDQYLRLGPDGTFANLNSPATYVNLATDANVPVPTTATSDATPSWHRLSSEPTVLWHDHRLHWMGSVPPDIVQADPGAPHVVNPEWKIPLLLGSNRADVTGQLLWVPPPQRALWLLGALVVFLAAAVVLVLGAVAWRVAFVGVAVVGLAANLTVAIGRVSVAHGSVGNTLATFALAAAIAAGSALALFVGRNRERISPWSAVPGMALIGGGVAYFAMLRYSQLHSTVDATIDRIAVVVQLGLGAALVTAVLVDRFTPADDGSVAGADA